MKNVSWIVALVVGVVIGVAGDRMAGGTPPRPRLAPARAPGSAPAPSAPRVEDQQAVYKVPIADSPLRGSPDALVTIVVASEFQCPFCKRVEPTLKAIVDAYPGKVRLAWKHQPLPFHPRAIPAAILAEEARAQGGDARFWAVHDRLFESAPALERADLERVAQEAGLDLARVRAALDGNQHLDRIRRDQALCSSLGATGTPTMFINGRKVVGALPLEALKPTVDEELRKAQALVASGVAPRDVYAKIQEKGATSVVYRPGPTAAAGAPSPSPSAAAGAAAPPVPAGAAAKVPLRADDPVRGPAAAPVTVVVFSDFQCPFCARVEPTLRQLEQAFPGKLRFVWKHLPLPPSMHPQARPAAEAAEAAREQGKFWEMHDRLFADQRALGPEMYETAARSAGLDVERFKRAVASHAGAARIDEDQQLASRLGASATPTLFVNGRRIEGAYPYESIRPVVEEELRKADALARSGLTGGALYDAACEANVKAFPAAAAAVGGGAPSVLPGGRAAVPVRRDDPVKGKDSAPITMVLFSDFQCPFCARATPAVKEIETSYPNDVRIVWKHLPLPMHPNAMPAALAAEAAREQGGAAKFWAMHDKLFANQASLTEPTFEQYARDLGLDLARFRQDMASPKLRARVEEDSQLAQRVGVNGTPTFLVNGEMVVGANGLKPAVERVLAAARTK